MAELLEKLVRLLVVDSPLLVLRFQQICAEPNRAAKREEPLKFAQQVDVLAERLSRL